MSGFNLIGRRKYWYILSTILILPGVISLFVWHLNVGIDFRGGTMQELTFTQGRPDIQQIRDSIKIVNEPGVTVQTTDSDSIIVRFPNTTGKTPREEGTKIITALDQKYHGVVENSFENIGGSVAQSTTRKAVQAIVITSVAIILFIAWSFASVPKPASSWRFGVTAILALAHDILFVVGAFSLIGHFFPQIEVDALFITALLTILGFSVNDTIVVFDRIRENLRRMVGKSFEEVANASLNQTIARSINTSATVLVVLLSLLLLGGSSIRNFILALTLGVAIGTYSSIFNASPLLVSWQLRADKRRATQKK